MSKKGKLSPGRGGRGSRSCCSPPSPRAPGAVAVQEPGAPYHVTIGPILLHIFRKQSIMDPQDCLTGGKGVLRDCGQGQSQPLPLLVHPKAALKQENMLMPHNSKLSVKDSQEFESKTKVWAD